ncbi:hypothetical protein FXV83_05295 [Bradyrhizobium hipponense]|uniref:ParB-like N-terminal domain-containing protein n=1 Tax=Bradyrhizobium hipponense TaxID=2605638 RepID=A0A5S4YVM5_9BRAD|nr:ParB N-terminal domain-containing protein [Bradyrhizobium hipponense]TYO67577.1 hypothetical protein FXV83_05295 [Bradyrhizobium hipponense]
MATKRKETDRRRAITRAGIKRPTDTGETVERIAAKLAANAGGARKHAAAGAVVKLALKDIRVATQVFQWRSPGIVPSDDLIFDMAKATQNTGALDPIVVLPVADEYYVIDGHHRLAAYKTAGWKGHIPAIVFGGSLDEAVREALRSNSKNKLPMTAKERTEAAWRLVKLGKPGEWPDSISDTVALCAVGKGTVNRMREAWTKLHSGQYEGIADLSWRQAIAKLDGKEQQAFDEASWLEERAQNLANDIERAKLHLSKNPEITALALEMLDPGLPAELMALWEPRRPFDPTQVDEDKEPF